MDIIDINTWNRKEHYEFFSSFDEPFFGIVVEVDCTETYRYAKENKISFYAAYLWMSLIAIHKTDELLFRIEDDRVLKYNKVHVAGTASRSDGTFGFIFIPYNSCFSEFAKKIQQENLRIENTTGMGITKPSMGNDVIHYSTFPWSNFTGLSHARNLKIKDSVPKITFAKMIEKEGRKKMSISIHAHHGLVDGLHVAQFLDYYQNLLDHPKENLS